MAKDKQKNGKGTKGIPNKHLHARVAFLHHAATYLASCKAGDGTAKEGDALALRSLGSAASQGPKVDLQTESIIRKETKDELEKPDIVGGLPFYFSWQLQQVAQKSQIRLHSSIKHASCKRCNAMLSEEGSHRKYVENLSRNGSKPHADVLVLECHACGTQRRFPIGAKRQQRKSARAPKTATTEESNAFCDTAQEGVIAS